MSRDPLGERERRVERPPASTRLNSDPFGEGGRLYGRALDTQFGDTVSVTRFVLKVLTLPLWLPFWLRKRYRIRKEMIRLGQGWQECGLSHREIAVRWAERFPQEYPLGEYDPGVRRLEARFGKLLKK